MKKIILLMLLALVGADLSAQPKTFTTDTGKTYRLGLKRDKAKFEAFKADALKMLLRKTERATGIAGATDLTSIVSPPEDQGQHGTCWDFGITKSLRSEFMVAGKDPGRLSFNYLICGNHTPYDCDSGGDFDAGLQMLNGKGPWLASGDPYPNCSGRCHTGPVAATAKKWVVVGPGNRPPTFEELATAISQKHSLTIDVAVCGSWGSYSGGIFARNECGANSINHIINLVGYDCQTSVDAAGNCVFVNGKPKNGDGYLKGENNWGPSWGEDGYIRTRYGVDAFADTAMYFEIDQPAPPTPPTPPTPPVPPVPPTPPTPPEPTGCYGWFMCFLGCWVPGCHQ